jgi:pimeloyl-ACP methyl ester carboxylesterase
VDTTFRADDGTLLAYHRIATGTGDPIVALPGGPMQSGAYLKDLTGAGPLIVLDPRGTGGSAVPADPATYRVDRQVADVEALRRHLGLDRIDVLGHSAGGSLAVLYAAAHPERIGRLLLITPSVAAVGVEIADADRRELAEMRSGEPWFPAAWAAFEKVWAGTAGPAEWAAIAPFQYGRWDPATYERDRSGRNDEAGAAYYAEGSLDPAAARAALKHLDAPVTLIAGQYDVGLPPKNAAEYAALFPRGKLVVIPGGGHYPWRDDPDAFEAAVTG